MSKTVLLLVLAALGVTAALAQGPASSPRGAEPVAEARTAAIERQVQRAFEALSSQPDQARRLADEALVALAHNPDVDLEVRTRTLLCEYFNERDPEAAERELRALRALVPKLRLAALGVGVLACDGELKEQSGDNAAALALYDQAVALAERVHDQARLADALHLRGFLRAVVGGYPAALSDLTRALSLHEAAGQPGDARNVLTSVASLYSRMGATEEARQHYETVLRSIPDGPASRERLMAQYNLGRSLEPLVRWDEAQHWYALALAQGRELGDLRGQLHALRGLAATRNARGDGQQAQKVLDEAQGLLPQVHDESLRGQLLTQRGAALRLLRRPVEAQPLLSEAIALFRQGDAAGDEIAARDELARSLADAGNWQQAYEQQALSRRLSQDLMRSQIDQRFAAMKVRFDTDSKDRENQLLQRENTANELALSQQRRAATLQIVAVVLASALAALAGVLAWHQYSNGRQLRQLAMTDELTGLPNRRQALHVLNQALRTRRGTAALMILDIDHFKRINDQHGHLAGDEILRAVAQAWMGQDQRGITLGRLGGEEFVALLPDGGLPQAMAAADRLRRAVAELDLSRWLGPQPLTVSVGVTPLLANDSLGKVLGRADAALYRAKSAGRNRVEAA